MVPPSSTVAPYNRGLCPSPSTCITCTHNTLARGAVAYLGASERKESWQRWILASSFSASKSIFPFHFTLFVCFFPSKLKLLNKGFYELVTSYQQRSRPSRRPPHAYSPAATSTGPYPRGVRVYSHRTPMPLCHPVLVFWLTTQTLPLCVTVR